jgi:microcystin-dependent protein
MEVPVGTIVAFAGAHTDLPAGWLICDGTAIPVQWTALTTLIGANTPNLVTRFLKGAATKPGTLTGGANTIAVSHMPAHDHGAATGYDGSHTHTMNFTSGNENADHVHVGVTSSDGAHAHAVNFTNLSNKITTGSSTGVVYSANADVTSTSANHTHTVLVGGQVDGNLNRQYHQHNISGTTATGSPNTHTHAITSQGGGSVFEPLHYIVIYIIKAG